MKRKIFSAVLALAMVLALLPTALAAWSSPYEDIDGSEWFGDEAVFVTDRGLMKGSAAGTFDPDGSITRGQLVTILYRMAGKPDASASAFTDVADGKYYSKAAAWAAASGIAAGYPDGTFRPEAVLTREQTAQILYAYSGYAGYDVTASGDLSAYPDAGSVGSDAAAAMGWAVAKKLIDGVDGKLLPQTGVTRAQTAVILTRFCKNVVPAVTTERFDDTYYLFQLPTGIWSPGSPLRAPRSSPPATAAASSSGSWCRTASRSTSSMWRADSPWAPRRRPPAAASICTWSATRRATPARCGRSPARRRLPRPSLPWISP